MLLKRQPNDLEPCFICQKQLNRQQRQWIVPPDGGDEIVMCYKCEGSSAWKEHTRDWPVAMCPPEGDPHAARRSEIAAQNDARRLMMET